MVGSEGGVSFVPHPVQRGNPTEYTTMMVPAGALDSVWRKDDKDMRVNPGGGGAEIGGRRAGVNEFLKKGRPLEASHVAIGPGGRLSFSDGRHRFSVLRDRGFKQVPVTLHKDDVDTFRKKLGIG